MKRFTETLKWQDPWFRKLSAPAKLLWWYMTDHCDCVGIADIDFDLVSFDSKLKVNESHMAELGDRVMRITESKYFIPKFIPFQYGELSETCVAHKKILQAVALNGLTRVALGYQYPKARVALGYQEEGDRVALPYKIGRRQEEEEDRKGESRGGDDKVESPAHGILDHLNSSASREFRHTADNLKLIECRLAEVGGDVEGVKAMITRQCAKWKTDPKMSEYLRPETLFGKQKFGGYYDDRNMPLNGAPHPPPADETPEQRKERRKREDSEMLRNAIG